jgi:hypothetical protein
MGKKFYSVLDGVLAIFALTIVMSGLNLRMVLQGENSVLKVFLIVASVLTSAACVYGIYDIIKEKFNKQ